MGDYYYTDGNDTFGPYSIDQLKNKNLSPDTLVWHERLPQWAQLKDLPEAAQYISSNTTPPPIPSSLKNKPGRKTAIEHSKIVNVRTVYLRAEDIIISKRVIKWLMIWTFFHIFALFTSYKEVPFFNESGEPKPNNFWPFVNFFDEYYVKEPVASGQLPETRLKFNGLFVNYDWTEFGCYVGGLLLLVVFYYLYKKAD